MPTRLLVPFLKTTRAHSAILKMPLVKGRSQKGDGDKAITGFQESLRPHGGVFLEEVKTVLDDEAEKWDLSRQGKRTCFRPKERTRSGCRQE